jgi:hypothetical protein
MRYWVYLEPYHVFSNRERYEQNPAMVEHQHVYGSFYLVLLSYLVLRRLIHQSSKPKCGREQPVPKEMKMI